MLQRVHPDHLPGANTDYQLFYSICSDYCQSYLDGTIMFNVTSFNDTEDYFHCSPSNLMIS